ncbi:MAG: CotH kinase family protein, partial [Aeromicrobium sp.]
TDESNSYGNAYLLNFPVNGTQKVFARKSNGERTEVDVIAPTPELTLSVRRDCTGNDCDPTATAYGEIDPVQAGRVVKLQYLNGSTWTQVGTDATTGADGQVEIPFSLAGLSQWSSRQYRLTSASDGSSPSVTSQTISFMPGPTELGSNVLRVDVEDGIFPSTKGPEYPAEATLSTDGEVFLDRVEVEDFGVRGFSTARYPKKPFKLKFEDSPTETGVFGMESDKSWTLLASWLDRSFVRDKVGLELGRGMNNSWTPDSRYVELFLNDRYQGAYLMTESVKIDGDRVDVDKERGMIVETDGTSVVDSRLGFTSSKGIVWAFKDPDEYDPSDPEQVDSAKLSAIRSRINAFESKLYSSTTREQYVNFLDVDKAIDFYFIREFTKERDGDMYRSNYVSWDPSGGTEALSDNKLHFGPAWDFDRSAGITGEQDAVHVYVDSPVGFYLRGTGTHSEHPTYRTHWFVQLFKSTSFKNAAAAQWDTKRSVFATASQIARDADAALGPGAENDQHRWPQDRRYEDHGSHQDEIDFVTEWYDDRFAWLDANL